MIKPIEQIGGMKLAGTEKITQEYEERERRLTRLLENVNDLQLIMFALWEIHAVTSDTSDAVSIELLKRSGVEEGLAKW